jgi:hypothetical protein
LVPQKIADCDLLVADLIQLINALLPHVDRARYPAESFNQINTLAVPEPPLGCILKTDQMR